MSSSTQLSIPNQIESLVLPQYSLTIQELLAWKFPPSGQCPSASKDVFSKNPGALGPTNTQLLRLQPLPSRLTVFEWQRHARVLGNQYQSFAYPIITDSQNGTTTQMWIQTWVIEVWRRIHEAREVHSAWSQSLVWLIQRAKSSNVQTFLDAITVAKDLPWINDRKTSGEHLGDSLSAYLGTRWLTDKHMGQLLALLRRDTIHMPAEKAVHFVDPLWISKLISTFRSEKARGNYARSKDLHHIRAIGVALSKTPEASLGGMINVRLGQNKESTLPGTMESGNHWVAFVYSSASSTLWYGDSYGHQLPDELRSMLKWWLGQHLTLGDLTEAPMECTQQKDTHSCGILAFNTLRHHFYPEKFNLVEDCDKARVEAFMEIMQMDPNLYDGIPRIVLLPQPPPTLPKKRKREHGHSTEGDETSDKPLVAEEPKSEHLDDIEGAGQWPEDEETDSDVEILNPADLVDAPIVKRNPTVGGRPANLLLNKLTVKCYKRSNPFKHLWRCAATSCGYTLVKRSLTRFLRHSKTCDDLTPSLRKLAISEALKNALSTQLEVSNEYPPSSNPSEPSDAEELPATKRQKTEPTSTKESAPSQSTKMQELTIQKGRRTRHLELDRAVMVLFCVGGLPTYLIERPEFQDLFSIADRFYKLPSRDKLEYQMIPYEQEFVKKKQIEYLKDQDDLTISYDGGTSRGKEAFWTVHVSTREDEVFLIEGREATSVSHTAGWIASLAKEAMEEIGSTRFCAVVSDSTGNTRGARVLLETEFPTVIKIPDCCHHFNLLAKDLAKIAHFAEAVTTVRNTIKFFSHSHGGGALLRDARKTLGIGRGLEAVGATRFGTLFLSANSVQRNIPSITKVALAMGKDEFEHLAEYYMPSDGCPSLETMTYQLSLSSFVKLGLPTTRSIACLEGEEVNAADVFLLAHATILETSKAMELIRLPPEPKSQVIDILNTRYSQLFISGPNASQLYLAAAFLHPGLLCSDLFKAELDLNAAKRSVPLDGIRNPQVFSQVGKYLLDLGEKEVKHGHKACFTKWKGKASPFKIQLRTELLLYGRNQYPYNNKLDEAMPRACLRWWQKIGGDENAQILPHLAVKIFSVRVNSMAEERTVSRLTWITPPLRNRLSVDSMIAMTQVGQYYRAKRPQKPRKPTNRIPVARVRFCDLKAPALPVDEETASTPDADDSWLDEPAQPAQPTQKAPTLLTDSGHINMESSILATLLSDAAEEPSKADKREEQQSADSDGCGDGDDDDFSPGDWL